MAWLTVFVGLGLRLWDIDLNRFYYDQVWLLKSANDFLDTGHLPLHGGIPLSIGVWLPPLVSYLLAIPSLVSRNPVWISICMAALDSLGAAFVYGAAWRMGLSRAGALAAGLAYAAAPAGIVFGRMIWNANFVPLLAAVALWGLVDFWTRQRSGSLAMGLLAIGCAAELHLVAGVYVLVWLAVAIAGRRHVRWWQCGAAILGLAVLLAPYLVWEVQSRWNDVAVLRQFLAQPKQTDLVVLERAAALAGSAIFWRMLPGGHAALWSGFDALTWALVGLTLAGVGLAIASRRVTWALVVVWLALPMAFSIRHSVDVTTWYLLGGIPAMALLQGLGLEWLGRLWPGRAQALSVGLAGTLVIASGGAFVSFQRQVAATNLPDEYDVPLRYSLVAARTARELQPPSPLFVAAPTLQGDVIPYLGRFTSYRSFSGRSVVVIPRRPAVYVAQASTRAAEFLAGRFGPPAATVSTSSGAPEFQMVRLSGEEAELRDLKPLKDDIAGMLRLEGYRMAPDGRGFELAYRVTDAARLAKVRFSQFAHLVDAAGKVWSRNPDSYDVSEQWQDGDLVVWPVNLDLPPETPLGGYWLETGFYDSFSRQPLGTPVRIGPLRVPGPPCSGDKCPGGAPLAEFDAGELSLIGVRWLGQDVRLMWQASGQPKASYTVFVHAVDASGKVVAQHDGLPRAGSFPTDLWQPGDRVEDVHPLGLAAAPGLRLEVGLYTTPDLRRLPVMAPDQAGVQDHVTVDASAAN